MVACAAGLVADCLPANADALLPDDAEANAALIAAAPELLAALERITNLYTAEVGQTEATNEAIRQARAAVATATGGAA